MSKSVCVLNSHNFLYVKSENAFDIFKKAVLNPDRKKRPDDDDFRRAKESLKDEF